MDPFTIAFYRCVLLALPAYSIILYRGEVRVGVGGGQVPSPRGRQCALVARSVLGVIHLGTHYHGVQHMPLGHPGDLGQLNVTVQAMPI